MRDPVSNASAALADPTRRAILARPALGEASVIAPRRALATRLPAVSKYLKVLDRAGLIARPAGSRRLHTRTLPTGSGTTAVSGRRVSKNPRVESTFENGVRGHRYVVAT